MCRRTIWRSSSWLWRASTWICRRSWRATKAGLVKQIIVAHGLTQSMSDCPQLVPLVDAVQANLGRKPREISADAGYCSEDYLLALATRKIHAYVATGRAKHPAETTRKVGGEMTQKMRQKLKRAGFAAGTDCESRSWSRCSGGSGKHEDFDNSCCVALRQPLAKVPDRVRVRHALGQRQPQEAHERKTDP